MRFNEWECPYYFVKQIDGVQIKRCEKCQHRISCSNLIRIDKEIEAEILIK